MFNRIHEPSKTSSVFWLYCKRTFLNHDVKNINFNLSAILWSMYFIWGSVQSECNACYCTLHASSRQKTKSQTHNSHSQFTHYRAETISSEFIKTEKCFDAEKTTLTHQSRSQKQWLPLKPNKTHQKKVMYGFKGGGETFE